MNNVLSHGGIVAQHATALTRMKTTRIPAHRAALPLRAGSHRPPCARPMARDECLDGIGNLPKASADLAMGVVNLPMYKMGGRTKARESGPGLRPRMELSGKPVVEVA